MSAVEIAISYMFRYTVYPSGPWTVHNNNLIRSGTHTFNTTMHNKDDQRADQRPHKS